MILGVLCSIPQGSILLIDEPEKGLNQAKQRDLAMLLETVRPDITLILATQSEAFCRGLAKSELVLVSVNCPLF